MGNLSLGLGFGFGFRVGNLGSLGGDLGFGGTENGVGTRSYRSCHHFLGYLIHDHRLLLHLLFHLNVVVAALA